jgi:hypothetical protein
MGQFKQTLENLEPMGKKIVYAMFRTFLKNNPKITEELGFEAAEEALIDLLDGGYLVLCSDAECENFWIEITEKGHKVFGKGKS